MNHDNPFASARDEVNPYAVPKSQPAKVVTSTDGVWRQGNLLVMHKMAVLPDVCIKSNQPADGYRLKRKLSHHHPAIVLAVLVNVLLYIILAAIMAKRATVMIGLSPQWRAIRKRRMAISWMGSLIGLGMLIFGLVTLDGPQRNDGTGGILVLLGIVGMIGFLLYGLIGARMISAKKIDDDHVYIKGAHPDFLARFDSTMVA